MYTITSMCATSGRCSNNCTYLSDLFLLYHYDLQAFVIKFLEQTANHKPSVLKTFVKKG